MFGRANLDLLRKMALWNCAFEESINLADRIGDEDRMLAAAVAFGTPALWGSREWGETDARLVALLERQLNRIADTDPVRRVRILSTLAAELSFGETAERGWLCATEALGIARSLGRPEELGVATGRCIVARTVNIWPTVTLASQ